MKNHILKQEVLVFVILCILPGSASLFAQSGGGATAFLQRPIGVEAISLGGAYASVARDPSAIFWNPAGLAQSKNFRIMSSYAILPLDQQHNFVGIAIPVMPQLVLGGGWINYGVDGIDRRDENKNLLGQFSSSDNAFIISVAKQFSVQNRGSFTLGASGKYLYSSIAGVTASGFGFDIGGLFRFDRFTIGASAQNLGSTLNWKTESLRDDHVPFTARGGLSYEFGLGASRTATSLRVSFEGAKTESQMTQLLVGAEGKMQLGIQNSFTAIRMGYGNKLFSGGISFGLGLDRNLAAEIQYAASQDFLTEGLLHHIGVVLQF